MDIKIDRIAGRIIVGPVKRLGRINVFEFDHSIPEDLFLEDLSDDIVCLHKLVYVPTVVIPFWGYIEELDVPLRFASPPAPGERRHTIYPAIGWKSQQTLKVLRKDVNILPNRFTVDRDIWNIKI